jgi:hypothetical protein
MVELYRKALSAIISPTRAAVYSAVAQILAVSGLEYLMKSSCILFLPLILVSCTSSGQPAPLTSAQAKLLAIQLANDKATLTYHRQPFHDGQPASFVDGHWLWRQLGPGDIEATVELAADGSTNRVILNLMNLTY